MSLLAELGRAVVRKVVKVALEEAAERVGEQTRNEIAAAVTKASLLAVAALAEDFDKRIEEAARRGYERGRRGE